VTVLFGYSVVAALVIDLIRRSNPRGISDVGTNFWTLWPEFTLICLAVALLAATFQRLFGPLGTLLTVIVVIFLGNPSTGGGNGVAYLPSVLAGHRGRVAAPKWPLPDPEHALFRRQQHHPAADRPRNLRFGRGRAHAPSAITPAAARAAGDGRTVQPQPPAGLPVSETTYGWKAERSAR